MKAVGIGFVAGALAGLLPGILAGAGLIGGGFLGALEVGALGGAISGVVAEGLSQLWDYGRIVSLRDIALAGAAGVIAGAVFAGVGYGIGRAFSGITGEGAVAAGGLEPQTAMLAEGPGDDILMAQPGAGLPGREGIPIPGRPTPAQLEAMTSRHGVEFAVSYKYGPGEYGGGGQYYLHSGEAAQVGVPLEADRMFIYHTHPGGTPRASAADRNVMDYLAAIGSPQRTSYIIPVGRGEQVVAFGGS